MTISAGLLIISMTACGGVQPVELGTSVQNEMGDDSYDGVRYPVVLCHGMYGFVRLAGVFDYWFGLASALSDGGADVYFTQVPALNSSEVRGEQLIQQIERILAITGKSKVNLIGHSQGAIDIRYVAAVRPDLVASVTSVAGPHKGTDLATLLNSHIAQEGFHGKLVDGILNSVGAVMEWLSGSSDPVDIVRSISSLSATGAQEFNAKFSAGVPTDDCGDGASEVAGIKYYSWTGAQVLTNFLDPTDVLFGATSLFAQSTTDGLVAPCSAHLGEVIRDDYHMNHLDTVNMSYGLVDWFDVTPAEVYRAHANRLKQAWL